METDNQGHILIVDDLEPNREILARILARQKYATRMAADGPEALEMVKEEIPDLILLDVSMPGMTGFEVCERIKADPATEHVPVIFVSAMSELGNKVKAFEVGAVDYIIKPYKPEEVVARVNSQVMLAYQRRQILQLSELKDQLLRTVSHDLKNPLHIIMGYAALMMDGVDIDTTQMVEMSTQVYQSADKMLRLVTNFLDLTQIEDGRIALSKVNISLRNMTEQLMNDFTLPASQKDIDLRLDFRVDDAVINADAMRIEQVFNNLISNAIKYTPRGGQVTLGVEADAHSVIISVEDTGLGIPPKDVDSLFNKFFRVQTEQHKEQEGTGLGLSIALAIVREHDGDIWVESKLGEGSRFSVQLPLVPDDEAEIED